MLAFLHFPQEHWRKIWSTNPLERLNKEIKRRTNVVGIFPNDAAIIRLVGSQLLEQQEEWQLERRRFFSEATMAKIPEPEETLELMNGDQAEQSSAANCRTTPASLPFCSSLSDHCGYIGDGCLISGRGYQLSW